MRACVCLSVCVRACVGGVCGGGVGVCAWVRAAYVCMRVRACVRARVCIRAHADNPKSF